MKGTFWYFTHREHSKADAGDVRWGSTASPGLCWAQTPFYAPRSHTQQALPRLPVRAGVAVPSRYLSLSFSSAAAATSHWLQMSLL